MIANHKGEIPFVILIIPFLLGIAVGLNFLSFAYITVLTVVLTALSLTFIGLNFGYAKFNIHKARWLGGALIGIILFLFGWISAGNYNELNHSDHFSRTPAQYLVAKINNEPTAKNGLLRFTATVEVSVNNGKRTQSNGTLLISIKDSLAKNLYYGDELLIPANYNTVDPPFNPAEFNYKKYLANQNIHYQAFLYHGQYTVLANNSGNPVVAYSLRLRRYLVEKLKSNMHDPDAIAVASTLILGYKADLSSDVLQAYSKTGTVHVLSVSGAHVAILYILLGFMLGLLDRYTYGKVLKAALIIGIIWYYALLTGFSPAVCRAAVMISMVITGKTYNRYINTLNILAVSAFILLVYDPFFIADVGFQLSYLAVAGLIIFQPIVYKWFHFKNKWVDKLWALCSVSIAAQVITFPLSAFYFHQFPVYFLLSNVFIVIPTMVIMYCGLVYLLLPQIPFLSKLLAYVLEQSILLMNKVLAAIEHAPFASINKIWINTTEYLLLYAIIISVFYFLYDKKVWLLKVALCCLLLLSINISIKKITTMQSNSIAFLNLRRHVGLAMKNGNNAVVITDLADTDKNYKYSIQPYLDSCKISCVNVYNLKQDIHLPFLLKKNNLIQFMFSKIVIANDKLCNSSLPEKLDANYLYVTGNPHASLTAINKNFVYHTLIIDGSNNDHLINNISEEAKISRVNYTVLKRNKAQVAVSN